MKTSLIAAFTILVAATNIFATPPSRYSSHSVRNSSGRTVGRESTRSSSGVKYHSYTDMKGNSTTSRQTTNPYLRPPSAGAYGYNNQGPHMAGKK